MIQTACDMFVVGSAAVARKAGEPLVIEEVIVAPPKRGEVRVRIICSSLCHSDVTFWKLKVCTLYFSSLFLLNHVMKYLSLSLSSIFQGSSRVFS